jgi:hypothetical protein
MHRLNCPFTVLPRRDDSFGLVFESLENNDFLFQLLLAHAKLDLLSGQA